MYSGTHVLMYQVLMYLCTHVLNYSCTHVLMYSCTHVLLYKDAICGEDALGERLYVGEDGEVYCDCDEGWVRSGPFGLL